jgi:hypothetical protein
MYEPCPSCGSTEGFTPVQRIDLGPGARYERYACEACRIVFERDDRDGWRWVPVPARSA